MVNKVQVFERGGEYSEEIRISTVKSFQMISQDSLTLKAASPPNLVAFLKVELN